MLFADGPGACVALMANSDNLGPHDGSLLGERFLDELLLLPGRAVVLTTGNLNHSLPMPPGSAAYHAFDAGPEPRQVRFTLEFAEWSRADAAEIWFEPAMGGSAPVVSAALHAGIRAVAVVATPVPRGTPTLLLDPGVAGMSAEALLQDGQGTLSCLRLIFRPPPDQVFIRGTWTIELDAAGPVHGWLDRNNSGQVRWAAGAMAGADEATLGSPAVAARALAVGAVVRDAAGGVLPWPGSGRGPTRDGRHRKPDLVAVGEGFQGAIASPASRLRHPTSPPLPQPQYARLAGAGTSYAAPQVGGACALVFARAGPWASWSDVRQILLESARRDPSMPPPGIDGWDKACGYGLLDTDALFPRAPPLVDVWLAKAPDDTGFEPYVAQAFWNSPALVLQDAAGAPLDPTAVALGTADAVQVRVQACNRGTEAATAVDIALWWAPLGMLAPLPGAPGHAWSAEDIGGAAGNVQQVAAIGPGANAAVAFGYRPPRDGAGNVQPHLLLARATCAADPFHPTEPLCARNNAAVLAVAAQRVEDGLPEFAILGSDDTDGVILWLQGCGAAARICLDGLPVSALPWRRTSLYERAGPFRPRHGDGPAEADPATDPVEDCILEGAAAIEALTDVQGATRLVLAAGRIRIEGTTTLTLPRLRLAPGTRLPFRAGPLDPVAAAGGAVSLLHLSGGRRIGGGTTRLASQPPPNPAGC